VGGIVAENWAELTLRNCFVGSSVDFDRGDLSLSDVPQ
jgi:hypothetical protein